MARLRSLAFLARLTEYLVNTFLVAEVRSNPFLFSLLHSSQTMSSLLNAAVLLCVLVLLRTLYLLLLHPLASYPGPLPAKLTNFWSALAPYPLSPCLFALQCD